MQKAYFKKIIFLLATISFSLRMYAQEDYTLQEALQVAKANNKSLQAEHVNIGIAQADVVTAGLRPNPELNNQTLQLAQSSHFPVNTQWYNGANRQVWWQLTKPFQIAGQRSNKISLANSSVALAEKAYGETERQVFSTVAMQWLEVWAAQKKLSIIKVAKSNIDSLVYTNQLRYKNEVITQTDLARTELLSRQYAIQVKNAAQDLLNKQNELQLVMGITQRPTVDTSDDFIVSNEEADSLLQQAAHRSDLVAAQSLINMTYKNIKLQKSLAYPQPEIGFIWNPQNAVQYFGVFATIQLPFFNRNQGEIKKSFLLKDQAERQLVDVQNHIKTETTVAMDSYQLQLKNIKEFEQLLAQSNTILNNVRYAYLRGGTTIIDFLEAQRSWLETQQQYYEAMQQYRQSYIQLLYATGLINRLAN